MSQNLCSGDTKSVSNHLPMDTGYKLGATSQSIPVMQVTANCCQSNGALPGASSLTAHPMRSNPEVIIRPARTGDGGAIFEITRRSVTVLAQRHYSADQIGGWMGQRTPDFYENLIAKGRMVIAERDGIPIGFVDAEPGELTRLFVLPEAAGAGIGKQLLDIGTRIARAGHEGPIKVEATINAEAFYRHHGFDTIKRGLFSHGLGGEQIEIVHMELLP